MRGGRQGWMAYSSIQHQKIIKRDSNSGPNELGLVFLPSAGGLFSEPSRVRPEFPRLPGPWGLAPPSPAAWGPPHSQGDGRRSRRARGDLASEAEISRRQDATRPRGGRPAPCGMSLSGSESHKFLLRCFKRSRIDTFRSFVRHLGP